MRVPVAPHSHQHLVLSVFWILAILTHGWWYLILTSDLPSDVWWGPSFYMLICHVCTFLGEQCRTHTYLFLKWTFHSSITSWTYVHRSSECSLMGFRKVSPPTKPAPGSRTRLPPLGRVGGSVSWASDFSSGHDLVVCGFEPRVGLCADSSEPGACFRFCSSSACALCLSQK